jgi:hypothetical protein
MSISELFSEKLGAPLSDTRWSWGAINQATGQVFLRAVRNIPQVDATEAYKGHPIKQRKRLPVPTTGRLLNS